MCSKSISYVCNIPFPSSVLFRFCIAARLVTRSRSTCGPSGASWRNLWTDSHYSRAIRRSINCTRSILVAACTEAVCVYAICTHLAVYLVVVFLTMCRNLRPALLILQALDNETTWRLDAVAGRNYERELQVSGLFGSMCCYRLLIHGNANESGSCVMGAYFRV